jgi:hypothetical protein
MAEAEKPKSEQRIKPDLFLEVYKSLHSIERHLPAALSHFTKEEYISAMVEKYLSHIVDNVVSFRDVSRMARGAKTGTSPEALVPVVTRLVEEPAFTVAQAYGETVRSAYQSRDLITRVRSLENRLQGLAVRRPLSPDLTKALGELRRTVDRLLTT